MQVSVCPKCGRENQPARASCFNCYTSLGAVVPTESKKTEGMSPLCRPGRSRRRPPARTSPTSQPASDPGPSEKTSLRKLRAGSPDYRQVLSGMRSFASARSCRQDCAQRANCVRKAPQ